MTAAKLTDKQIGLPAFKWRSRKSAQVFDLSSHARAREALEFGIGVRDPGFNIFVLGQDRSGRMTETLKFLRGKLEGKPPGDDWVYLNNFRRTHRPKPYPMPAGVGRKFRDAMAGLIPHLREALKEAFESESHRGRIEKLEQRYSKSRENRLDALKEEARKSGLDLVQTPEGIMVVATGSDGTPVSMEQLTQEERDRIEPMAQDFAKRINTVNRDAAAARSEFFEKVGELSRRAADEVVEAALKPIVDEFAGYGLRRWFVEMQQDIIDNIILFAPPQEKVQNQPPREPPERRYAVNLLVDNGDVQGPNLVLEGNPSYENLFGRIEYRPGSAHLETDFTLIRAGALHRANGGVLVLRAEALVMHPLSWNFLKGALRDRTIRVEELHRQTGLPMAGAPSPKTVPLDVKVVIVGQPQFYYDVFSRDPEFHSYFKVKADIDADMPAKARDLSLYARLIVERCKAATDREVEDEAIAYLLGLAARWAGARDRLTARPELLDDLMVEAEVFVSVGKPISRRAVVDAITARRRRNERIEDRMHERIEDGTLLIATEGREVGEINALTVRDIGDHAFGTPSRVTARASVGRHGIINIERHVMLGGPIQQKGAMVLQGYLAGLFGQSAPCSFDCSITFEQSYGGIEGDSASLAELIAILSALSGIPVRQDLAITGSVNQVGDAQSVGGVHHKVEGFFEACRRKKLTGTQGVVLPHSNRENLVVDDPVLEAVEAGRFRLYTVRHLDDAIELFFGMKAGNLRKDGTFTPGSVYEAVRRRLQEFDRIQWSREARLVSSADPA